MMYTKYIAAAYRLYNEHRPVRTNRFPVYEKRTAGFADRLRYLIRDLTDIHMLQRNPQDWSHKLKCDLYTLTGGKRFKNYALQRSMLNFLYTSFFYRNPIALYRKKFFVLASRSVLTAYYTSENGVKERRSFISLHRKPPSKGGPAITVAFMPPFSEQLPHRHACSPEYNFFINTGTVKTFVRNGTGHFKLNQNMPLEQGNLIMIPATTQHTLANETVTPAINLTVKPFVEKRVFLSCDTTDEAGADEAVSVPGSIRTFGSGFSRTYRVTTVGGFSYQIEYTELQPRGTFYAAPVDTKKRDSDEVTIQFSRTESSAYDTVHGHQRLGHEDVLYVRHNNGYWLKNDSSSPAILYRLVILQ